VISGKVFHMNMHGFIAPPSESTRLAPRSRLTGALDWIRSNRSFLFVVVIPTLLVAGYYYLIAAKQYQSEAHFVIRSAQDTGPAVSGFGQLLGLSGGATSSEAEARGVSDYLQSHEAVQTLRSKLGLVERFQRPEADFLAVCGREPDPREAALLLSEQGPRRTEPGHGISELKVRSFRPADSYDIIKALLLLGEDPGERTERAHLSGCGRLARTQLVEAERAAAIVSPR
jgi:capsular polysaccharide transport system permease protein